MMNKMHRKDLYYLTIAEAVAGKSTCLRRCYGAVIVKDDEIISTGYNGSPRGCPNCCDTGCMREILGTKKGDAYNLCMSVHAEQNAIISASRRDMIGSTLYIVGVNSPKIEMASGYHYADPTPCLLCHRMIVNAGISRVVGMVEESPGSEAGIREFVCDSTSFFRRVQAQYNDLIDQMEAEASTEEDHHTIERAKALIEQRTMVIERDV